MKIDKILKIVLVLMLVVTVGLVVAAAATGGSPAMVGYNLVWAYFLIAAALASAVICAIMGMVSAPAGIKATALSVGLVAVVVLASYYISAGHTYQIADISNPGTYFGAGETLVTETSVLVTYVAVGAAILVSLLSELMGVVEGFKSKSQKVEEVE